MKKEITAAIILVVIITLSFLNIGYVDKKVNLLKEDADKTFQLSSSGDIEHALTYLKESEKKWLSFSGYAGVMLRHSDEISDVTDTYFAMLQTLQAGRELSPSICEKLKHGLNDIAETESIKLSSLF